MSSAGEITVTYSGGPNIVRHPYKRGRGRLDPDRRGKGNVKTEEDTGVTGILRLEENDAE